MTIAHSPDPDDAFMFYALAKGKLDTGDLEFRHVLQDIETLNKKAAEGTYEVTAISFHGYAYVSKTYALLSSGASIGDGYGPLIIAANSIAPSELKHGTIAVPGTRTTAFLALKMFESDIKHVLIPFDKIIDAVADGAVDAGLIIHEGQLTYSNKGLHKVLDLGQWWAEQTGLPLPLGGNAIRRDLGDQLMMRVSNILRQSIRYALDHRKQALDHALAFARDMNSELADRFVGMYVNDFTLDYGPRGKQALKRLYEVAHEKGIIPHPVDLEFY